jgi:diguanylate cyclase (GGDEF)-like protein/PAS domain S-box-containing protein
MRKDRHHSPTIPSSAEENLRLRLTLDQVGAYVFTKDLEGRYTYANDMVCALFGQPLERIVGCRDDQFFDLTLSDELIRDDVRVLTHGERIQTEENVVIAETGERRTYWTVKSPLRDADGRITGLCGISTDITERRRLEADLAEQRNLLSLVLENIDAFVYMKGPDRRYRYVNGKTADLFRMPAAEIVGRLDEDIHPRETAERFAAMDRAVIGGGVKATGEESIRGPDGRIMQCWSIKIPLFREGVVDGLIGISTDISEVVRLKNEFHELARTDALTGLLTRRFLIDQAEQELKGTRRRGTRLALLLVDIDDLKRINDTYGHAFGDTYIVAIVDACRNVLRGNDLMGRLAGDEFVIIVKDTDEAGMAAAADRVQNAVRTTVLAAPDGTALSPSVSIGAALSGSAGSIEAITATADAALYQAKKAGRDCWRADTAQPPRLAPLPNDGGCGVADAAD